MFCFCFFCFLYFIQTGPSTTPPLACGHIRMASGAGLPPPPPPPSPWWFPPRLAPFSVGRLCLMPAAFALRRRFRRAVSRSGCVAPTRRPRCICIWWPGGGSTPGSVPWASGGETERGGGGHSTTVGRDGHGSNVEVRVRALSPALSAHTPHCLTWNTLSSFRSTALGNFAIGPHGQIFTAWPCAMLSTKGAGVPGNWCRHRPGLAVPHMFPCRHVAMLMRESRVLVL